MEWNDDMDAAPKDGTRVLLYRPSQFEWARVVGGRYKDDRHAKKPRPYWEHDQELLSGTLEARSVQPTHWMPLPAPPQATP